MDEGINKVWSIHTVEDKSVFKRKEMLTHSTTCRNLEDIKLSATEPVTTGQRVTDPTSMTYMGSNRTAKVTEAERRWWLPRAGGGEWGVGV